MAIKFSNNASATLASSINSAATTIVVTAGQGTLFPSLGAGDYFYGTLVDSSNNMEIVKVTARVTDTLTVVRAQDGTTARAYTAGDRIELRPVAAAMADLGVGTNVPAATTSVPGIVQLNNTTNSTSQTQAPTANALKTTFDLATAANTLAGTANTTADAAMPKTGGTFSGNITAPNVIAAGGANSGFTVKGRDNSANTWQQYVNNDIFTLYSNTAGADRFTINSSGDIFAVRNMTSTGTMTAAGYNVGASGIAFNNGTIQYAAAPVIGQTWQSFDSSQRQQGVTYTNDTGKTIQVFGTFGCNSGGQGFIYINGSLIARWSAQFNGCGGWSCNMGALIPPGATYMLANMSGGFNHWWELR